MTTRKYSSVSQETTLTSALNSSATTMVVASSTAVLGGITLANTSPLETFVVVIDPDTALEEIVEVTYPSSTGSNTLTIVRGRDGTTGISHSAGAKIRHMAIGRDFRESNTHIEASSGVHGVTGTLVGTTDTQTLTNKTFTAPVITSLSLGDGSIVFEGATADSYETTLTVAEPTADRTVTIPDATTTLVGTDTTQTLTNKTLTSPTITGTGAIAGTFTGNITGNVTGNVSGNAGTVTNGVYTTDTGIVTSTMIANGTIVNADINSSAAIDKTKISGTAITAADTGTVTSTMIADATIVNGDISATAAIAKTKLNLGGTITSADLVDGTIVASDIADGTITAAKMISDPYARSNHTGTQTASTISDFNTAVRTNRLDQMAAPTAAVDVSSQKITSLATPTSNADAATKLYVDTKVADLVNSAPSTLDTLGEIATAISAGGSVVTSLVAKSGDTMTGALVLNADPSLALGAATKQYVDAVAGSATAAAASATAAAASYDSFDDRYLGSKSTAPSVDNDGNALIEGALYWNSVDDAMYVWNGSAWGGISSTASIYRFRFTASGGETSLSGTDANGLTLSYLAGKEQVYLNGVLLARTSDYTATDGSSITSLAALAANDVVEIITFTAFDLATAISNTLFDAKGDLLVATSADTPGKLTAGTNGYVLKANSSTATGLEWADLAGTTINVASGTTVPLTIQNNGTGNSFVVNDVASDTTPFVVTANGNVGVGWGEPTYKLQVYGEALGGTATNESLETYVGSTAGTNTIFEKTSLYRHTTGSDWTGTSIKKQMVVDGTAMGYIEYNPVGISQGIAIGTNSTPRITVAQDGSTTINAVADATTTTAARGGGYMGVPQSSAATTGAYTIVAADAGEHIYSTATRTVTIPANASVAFPVGTAITFIAATGTTVTIAITSDTLLLAGAGTTGSRTLAPFGMATAIKITSTSWIISGNGLS